MGLSQRSKGARFERQVANDLKLVGIPARRNLAQYQQTDGRDLEADAPLCVQCKVGQRPNPKAAWLEAAEAAEEGELPIAVCHWDHGPTLALVEWSALLAMLGYLRANGEL